MTDETTLLELEYSLNPCLEAIKRMAYTQTGYTELDVTAKYSYLKNLDLMTMTFSHLQVRNDNTSLLNAALTCKDFLDVALSALWEKMYSWKPLLKLLPALQLEDGEYVCANVHVFRYDLILSLDP